MPDSSCSISAGGRDASAIADVLRLVQERVDRQETSWAAVLRGADAAPVAVRLRALARRGGREFRTAVDALAARNRATGRPDPRDQAKEALVELQDARLRLLELLDGPAGTIRPRCTPRRPDGESGRGR